MDGEWPDLAIPLALCAGKGLLILLLCHTYFLAWILFHYCYTSFSENRFPVRPVGLAYGSCFSCVSNFLPSDFYNPFFIFEPHL